MQAAHSELGGNSIASAKALSGIPRRFSRTLLLVCIALMASPAASLAAPGTISTFAGNPLVGGLATTIGQRPAAVAVSGQTLYVADWNKGVVHAIDMRNDNESTVAGTGGQGYTGDGVPATGAELSGPGVLAVDQAGNLLIADSQNNRVRLIAAADCSSDCPYGLASTTKGDIYTVAGNGSDEGPYLDGAPATEVSIQSPSGVAVSSRGDLLISMRNLVLLVAGADCASDCPYGFQSLRKGDVYTLAGQEYVGFNPGNGGPATSAGIDPTGLAVDGEGNVLIANAIYYEGLVSLVAAKDCNSNCPYGLAATTAGHIYTIAGADGSVGHTTTAAGSGTPATSQYMTYPTAVQVDSAGNVVIDDQNDGLLLLLAEGDCASSCAHGLPSTTKGDMYTIAGGGSSQQPGDRGPATDATLLTPSDLAIDSEGNLEIAENEGDYVRFLAQDGCSADCAFGLSSTTANDIYTVAGNGTPAFSRENGSATGVELSSPSAVTSDAAGNVLILDSGNGRVRAVAATDCASACAYGLPATMRGDIYTIAGGGTSIGDGVPARSAQLTGPPHGASVTPPPAGIAVDQAGDVLVPDSGNNRVRLIAAADCAEACPYGLQSTTRGDIYTVAGNGSSGYSGDDGPARQAELGGPLGIDAQGIHSPELSGIQGIAVDAAGDLLIADTSNERIRLVAASDCSSACPYGLESMTEGDIYTVVGDGEGGNHGDLRPALSAELNDPANITLDAAGDLLIADTGNHRVREVAAHSCTSACPYGRSSTIAGDIYPLAGTGSVYNPTLGESNGDGAKAISAKLVLPGAVAVDSAGDVLIGDSEASYMNVVRLVAATTCSSNCAYGLPSTSKGDIYTVAGAVPTIGSTGDGGPATSASLADLSDLGFDAAGDLLIAESESGRIRLVTAASPEVQPEGSANTGVTNPSSSATTAPPTTPGVPGEVGVDAVVISRLGSVRFTVPARRLRVSSRGVLALQLKLSQAASGKVKFAYSARSHGKRITALLASGSFSTSHAGTLTLHLRLTRRGHTLLSNAGQLRSVLTVTSGRTAGNFPLELWTTATRTS
jgi:trimeric autotransporter adhesin